jgi:hypothetical protein
MAPQRAQGAHPSKGRKKTRRSHARRTPQKRQASKSGPRTRSSRKWSQRVTRESDALDLEAGVFTLESPQQIAASLKRSAEQSKRRKANPFRSALSMLTFYLNRAGKTLPAGRKKTLNRAKDELRRQFGRE